MGSKLFTPLLNMIKEGCEKNSALFIHLIFHSKNVKVGGNHIMKLIFFSSTQWPQLLVPLNNSYDLNISEVYSHSYMNFLSHQGDQEH